MMYLYEGHQNFSVIPSYFVVFGPMALISTTILDTLPNGLQIDPSRVRC